MFIIMKKMETAIYSINEFKKIYYPNHYKEELIQNMTPEERGKDMAKKSIDKIIKFLKN